MATNNKGECVREGRLDMAQLATALAGLMRHLGETRLVEQLSALLRVLVPADDVMVVVYRRGQPPELVHDVSAGRESATNLALYLKGAYLLDPFYRAFADGVTPGCYRLQQLAPASFRSSEYYRLYYVRTGISDEIGFLLGVSTDICVHISVGVRGQKNRFSAAQHRRLGAFMPLLEEVVKQQWTPHDRAASRALTTQLDSALKFFGHDFLTQREAEVIQLLLRGHSTKSIAERLRISPETVKLHRKHSYAKLDVSSQAELFHLFIDALGSYRGGDPLKGYLTR